MKKIESSTEENEVEKKKSLPKISRRDLIVGLSAATAGVAGKMLVDSGLNAISYQQDSGIDKDIVGSLVLNGDKKVPFYGKHQAGIATPPPAFAAFLGYNLKPKINKVDVIRLMKLLTDDAYRITQGEAPLADTEPELVDSPAKLTITFGFGPGLFQKLNLQNKMPSWLRPLPHFKIDRLQPQWGQPDLLVQVCSDDPVTNFHAKKIIMADTEYYSDLLWIQEGFRRAFGTESENATMRNLFGQVDGSANPVLASADFDKIVWLHEPAWMNNGTSLVLRRIEMNFKGWDQIDTATKENVIGRKLTNGAPLSGKDEFDEPDFSKKDPFGFEVIDPASHMRRARSDNPEEKIFRRGYNYDLSNGKSSDAGLIFASFQADILKQFLPIQQRLATKDLFNEWIIPIGSALFAVPPGCQTGGYIGETLLDS